MKYSYEKVEVENTFPDLVMFQNYTKFKNEIEETKKVENGDYMKCI